MLCTFSFASFYDWILRKTQQCSLYGSAVQVLALNVKKGHNYFFKNIISIIQKNVFTYFSLFDVLEAQYLDSISKT